MRGLVYTAGLFLALAAGQASAQDTPSPAADPNSAPAAAAPNPSTQDVARSASTPLIDSGRLLLTQGISNIEGSAGGGLASWAVISGYGTRDAIGGNVHATYVGLPNYRLYDYGASVGLFDRLELSFTRQNFDTGSTGGKLGLGNGYTFYQDIVGAKVKLFGDAVYEQNSLIPQVAAGVQFKHSENSAIVHAVGARNADGVDFYFAATKILLNGNLVLDATLRLTKANQTGLLGFGGDLSNAYHPEFEGSAAYLLTRRLAIGGELRTKPDDLGFAHESNWYDAFAAYAINKNLSVSVAYVDLGSIATFRNQRGVFVSLQAGF